jgi:ABC-2 type transport system permease protein
MTMRFFIALLQTNLRASFALRAAFWMQAGFMALNNVLFFTIWWILFDRFEEIRGWRVEDMAALYGIAAFGYGVAAVLAGGLPDLARKIDDGDLDSILTQPKSVLVQAISSRTRPDGWGDLVSGTVLIALSGMLGSSTWPFAVLAVALASTMFVASGVMLHSAAFYVGRVGSLARQLQDFLLTFAVYPPTLFGGPLKVFLFTVLPAGLISYLPVEILRSADPTTIATAIAGTVGYATVAWWVFHRGLRRYCSGNRFGMRY